MEPAVPARARPRFGSLLRRYRLAAGITQEELAERARLSRRSITALERGAAHTPRRETLELLATALALTAPEHAAFLEAGRGGGRAAVCRDGSISRGNGSGADFSSGTGTLRSGQCLE